MELTLRSPARYRLYRRLELCALPAEESPRCCASLRSRGAARTAHTSASSTTPREGLVREFAREGSSDAGRQGSSCESCIVLPSHDSLRQTQAPLPKCNRFLRKNSCARRERNSRRRLQGTADHGFVVNRWLDSTPRSHNCNRACTKPDSTSNTPSPPLLSRPASIEVQCQDHRARSVGYWD